MNYIQRRAVALAVQKSDRITVQFVMSVNRYINRLLSRKGARF